MSRSCVCGGENENCRYCGGSGIIGDERLGSALDDKLRRATIENSVTEDIKASPRPWWFPSNISPSPLPKWIKCPKGCGRWVNVLDTKKVERHLQKCAGVRVAQPQKNAPAPLSSSKPEEISFDFCPLCGVKLKASRIQRHMSKAHGTSTSNPAFAELARRAQRARQDPAGTTPVQHHSAPSRPERTFCPVCKVTVNVGRLKRHMAKVHKRGLASRPQVTSDKDPTRQDTTLVAQRDKNLDATKLYAHAYREQGKYGSHPSHDGFDDESSPD